MAQLRDAQTSELLATGTPEEVALLAKSLSADVLYDDVGVSNVAVASQTWTAVGGGVITLPLQGDYQLMCSASLWADAGSHYYSGVWAVTQSGSLTITIEANNPAGTWRSVGHAWARINAIPAQNLDVRMYVDTACTVYTSAPRIAAQPIRVG